MSASIKPQTIAIKIGVMLNTEKTIYILAINFNGLEFKINVIRYNAAPIANL